MLKRINTIIIDTDEIYSVTQQPVNGGPGVVISLKDGRFASTKNVSTAQVWEIIEGRAEWGDYGYHSNTAYTPPPIPTISDQESMMNNLNNGAPLENPSSSLLGEQNSKPEENIKSEDSTEERITNRSEILDL